MDDLIRRKDAIDAVYKSSGTGTSLKALKALPSAYRPTGKWLKSDGTPYEGKPDGSCWCSECGAWLVASDEYDVADNFCPHCGVDMREDTDVNVKS